VSGGFLPKAVRGTRYSGLVALWDWYATFCALAGADPTDTRAAAAGLPPVDSIDQSSVLLRGVRQPPPRTELPLSTEPRATDLKGAPACRSYSTVPVRAVATHGGLLIDGGESAELLPADGRCATLNGLIQLDPDGRRMWKLLLGDVEQAFVTGPYFPNSSTPAALPAVSAHCGSGCLFDLTADPVEASDVARTYPERVKAMRQRLETLLPTAFNPHRGALDPACCEAALGRHGGFFGPFVE